MRQPVRWSAFLLVASLASVALPALARDQPDPDDAADTVDRLLAEEAAGPGEPAPRADDETFLRRVFQDLVGKPPTARATARPQRVQLAARRARTHRRMSVRR